MSTVENPPKITPEEMLDSLFNPPHEDIAALIEKINEEYEYWDSVKYKKCPKNCSSKKLWTFVKASRMKNMIREVAETQGIEFRGFISRGEDLREF